MRVEGDVQKNLYFMHNKAQDNLQVWIHTEQRMTINNKDYRNMNILAMNAQ